MEGPLQSTRLSVALGQRSYSLSISASQDTCAEQSCVPSETPRALKLPEESKVPYSKGVLKGDGPDLRNECSKAPRDG